LVAQYIDNPRLPRKALSEPVERIDRRVVVAAAAYVGRTRLIDNVLVAPARRK
jgi:pantothenate synthetase